MTAVPLHPTLDDLPSRLPIFPLTGVLLLPRARLPLHVFEPRYLSMVSDALGAGRMIGMIQPVADAPPEGDPLVYDTGCAGRIVEFRETDDGRCLIALSGVCRFHVQRETTDGTPYRTVAPDWSEFAGDLGPGDEGDFDRSRLLRGLKRYFRLTGMSVDWADIESSPCERLINALAMICPLGPSEKQALLEAPDLNHRARLLIAMIEMIIVDTERADTGGRAASRH